MLLAYRIAIVLFCHCPRLADSEAAIHTIKTGHVVALLVMAFGIPLPPTSNAREGCPGVLEGPAPAVWATGLAGAADTMTTRAVAGRRRGR